MALARLHAQAHSPAMLHSTSRPLALPRHSRSVLQCSSRRLVPGLAPSNISSAAAAGPRRRCRLQPPRSTNSSSNSSPAQPLAPEAASLAPAAASLAPDATALSPTAAAAAAAASAAAVAEHSSASTSAAAAGQPGSDADRLYRGTAVVVGAGPAGVTAALYLAADSYRVHVLERRGHPAEMEADKKRTYLIGLGERGLRALDGVGLTVPLSVGRPMRGSVYAYKSGKRVEDPFTPDTRIVGVDRQGLAAFLVNEASTRHPQGITFHWNAQPAAFDLQAKTLRCQVGSSSNAVRQAGAGSGPLELQYDLLIGADGSGSAVRDAMAAALPSFKVQQLTSPVAEMEYKAFHNLPWNDGIRQLLPSYAAGLGAHAATGAAAAAGTAGSADPGMTFFAFNNPQPNQPSPGSITLYLNAGGTWSGTLYQPPGKFEAMAGDVAGHEAAVAMFAPPGFPDSWLPLMAQQMASIKPSRISPMNLVSQLAAPSLGVVLLGDAGHNVTPQMGQGCNSALEDGKMLAAALQQAGHDVAAGLSRFEQQRLPQVHALQRMEEENSWVRRPPQIFKDPLPKTLARIAWVSFFMLLPLLRLLPGMKRAVHASLFQTIMSTTIPYNRLQTLIRLAPFVWAGLIAGLVAGVKQMLRVGMAMLA